MLVSDNKSRPVLGVHGGALFAHAANASASRTARERGTELGQLLVGANGIDFDATVRQIPRIAAYQQTLRGMLGKVAEPNPLYNSRDEVTPGLFELAHKAVDCSRQRIALAAMAAAGGPLKFITELR